MAWDIGAHEYVSSAVTASPSNGTVRAVGQAPTARLAFRFAVPAAALVLAGLAPSVTIAHVVSPRAGTVRVTGAAPALREPSRRLPGAGALRFVGQAPVARIAYRASPSAGALRLTGRTPTDDYRFYQPGSYTLNVGTIGAGTLDSALGADGVSLRVDEVFPGAPGFDIEFAWAEIPSGSATLNLSFTGYYKGNPTARPGQANWLKNSTVWFQKSSGSPAGADPDPLAFLLRAP